MSQARCDALINGGAWRFQEIPRYKLEHMGRLTLYRVYQRKYGTCPTFIEL